MLCVTIAGYPLLLSAKTRLLSKTLSCPVINSLGSGTSVPGSPEIYRSVNDWTGTEELFDDMTLMLAQAVP